jgi:hypothetical protein
MKKYFFRSLMLLLAIAFVFNACKKEEADQTPPPGDQPTIDYNQGLGADPGYPIGFHYSLPSHIELVGDIRGGLPGRSDQIDKETYKGPFPACPQDRSWITYGTGTYVNLYMKFYNTLTTPATLSLPGGLIFCDTQDNNHEPSYQRGLLLQTVNIPIPAQDTAFVHLPCYCLNMALPPPSFNTVYYIGPVTMNPQLNQMILIMSTKQYPYGEEGTIQGIVWNITDNGQTLTAGDIQYLNSLP